MEYGNNYLITYNNMNGKQILATLLNENDEMYFFLHINGNFAITKRKIEDKEITLELVEED